MFNDEEKRQSFYLTKWYIDLIDNHTGDVVILYLGELRWNIFRIPFTNILQFLQRHRLLSSVSFSAIASPELTETIFRIDTPQITGQWVPTRASIKERLYENAEGYIEWECLMPCAEGRMVTNSSSQHYQGLGYVERLILTLKPWQLPMDNLRWGRFLSPEHTIVWIQWLGKEEKCLIVHNGNKYVQGIIDDDHLQFDQYRLVLSKKHILRDGPVSRTVFDGYKAILNLFPSNFLSHWIECKWQTWSEFYSEDRFLADGWSIHENVDMRFPSNLLGKIAYGSLFTILLPLLLILWAQKTEHDISLPVPDYPMAGLLLTFLGFLVMILGMKELWFQGNGLPMNAYPPPKFVTTGIYAVIAHPIYVGASFTSFGLSIYLESRSGFWLISPFLTLAWLALVYGYENENLQHRFPHISYHTVFHVPDAIPQPADPTDRLSVYALVLLPWLILYETVIFVGIPSQPWSTYLPFEHSLPVIEWTTVVYELAYPYVFLLPCFLHTKQQLRAFMFDSWMNIVVGISCQFIFPFVAEPKPFIPSTLFGYLLQLERQLDGANGALPSFHVSWAFLSAYHYTQRFPRWKTPFYLLSILIAISCLTSGMHSLMDVIAGWFLFFACIQRNHLLSYARWQYERLANSWHAYRLGPMRILNSSFYAFPVGFISFFLVCSWINQVNVVAFVSCSSLFCAALCGQFIERASGLSRPFGYFGCILGGVLSSLVSIYLFPISLITIVGAFALASPWIQAGGRLRCIIQGCCHGRPTKNRSIGIIVTHPKSRVCSLSQLTNIPTHPTAGYSIVGNVLLGMFLWRLWYSEVPLTLIISLYFILIGLCRFVEETFRGEVQTPVYCRLKIYQWMSIIFVFVGIGISILPKTQSIQLIFLPQWIYLMPSIAFGLFATFLMCIDFPESTCRFSRLAD